MPGSMPEGKQFIKDYLATIPIKRILDIGPGSGNYYDLLTKRGEYRDYPGDPILGIEWVAVEIYSDYIDIFNLREKYSSILICDVYDMEWDEGINFDVVILGDVLEHMPEYHGVEVIRRAVEHSKVVVLSLPIIDYPQGESWGNIHEAHVEQYSPQKIRAILRKYEMIDYFEGEVIGTYIFRKSPLNG